MKPTTRLRLWWLRLQLWWIVPKVYLLFAPRRTAVRAAKELNYLSSGILRCRLPPGVSWPAVTMLHWMQVGLLRLAEALTPRRRP